MSVAIESNLSEKEKEMKKGEIRKIVTTKRKEAFNQAESNHRQRFQENTLMICKTRISRNQATISLIQPNPRINHSPFSHLQSYATYTS